MPGGLELNNSAEQKLTVIHDKNTSIKVNYFQQRMFLREKLLWLRMCRTCMNQMIRTDFWCKRTDVWTECLLWLLGPGKAGYLGFSSLTCPAQLYRDTPSSDRVMTGAI